jgi:hypothetical protein
MVILFLKLTFSLSSLLIKELAYIISGNTNPKTNENKTTTRNNVIEKV